VVILPLLARLA